MLASTCLLAQMTKTSRGLHRLHSFRVLPKSPEVTAVEDDLKSQNMSLLFSGLDQLDDRSRDIINSRWLTDDKGNTADACRTVTRVSAERIRQLEVNAMNKMRASP